MTVPVSELQKLAPSAIIELFEIHLVTEIHGANTVFRFHAGTNAINNGNIVWAGNSYQAFPVEATGFEYNGNGQLPRPKLVISNVLRFVTSILLAVNETNPGNDLNGAKFIRIRTLSRYLDAANFSGGNANADPTAEFPREIYYLDRKVVETRAAVEWELAAAFDLVGVRAPKRQCIANLCQWVYRSAECSYTAATYFDANNNSVGSAAADVCGKRLTSCATRFGVTAQLPFGSYPGVGLFAR
jgi:lambda family phage minor tail protein L